MKHLLLLLTIPFILSACGRQALVEKKEASEEYAHQTESIQVKPEVDSETIQLRIEALNEEINILEAPFLAEIESLDAELVAMVQRDQVLWNLFWDQMDEDNLRDKSFDQAIRAASHLDDQAKNQLLASHKEREANIGKRNQIYDDMYKETQDLLEELNTLYMEADDMALVDVGDRLLPMDEVENETWEDMEAGIDKWLMTIEGLSDQDRQAYADLETQIRVLNREDDKAYEAYQAAEEPFKDQIEACYQEYEQIQIGLEEIYDKMTSEENYKEVAAVEEAWAQGSEAPSYAEYVASMTFLTQEEKDHYVQANTRMEQLDRELNEIQAKVWASIPEVQRSMDARAKEKDALYLSQLAIMEKLEFTYR